jgi:hypothetical protein
VRRGKSEKREKQNKESERKPKQQINQPLSASIAAVTTSLLTPTKVVIDGSPS